MESLSLLTSNILLDLVKSHNKNFGVQPSDTLSGKAIGLTATQVSLIRSGKQTLNDVALLKVAALIGAEPAYLLACGQVERAVRAKQDGVADIWRRAAVYLSQLHSEGADT